MISSFFFIYLYYALNNFFHYQRFLFHKYAQSFSRLAYFTLFEDLIDRFRSFGVLFLFFYWTLIDQLQSSLLRHPNFAQQSYNQPHLAPLTRRFVNYKKTYSKKSNQSVKYVSLFYHQYVFNLHYLSLQGQHRQISQIFCHQPHQIC